MKTIKGDETLDQWVRDNYGVNYDWSLSKDEDNYIKVNDVVVVDDFGNTTNFYIYETL